MHCRLNLAQSFNPLGSILGVILSKYFILASLNQADIHERAVMTSSRLHKIQAEELSAVMGPYVGVAFLLIVLWIFIARIKMPKAGDTDKKAGLSATFRRLFSNKNYRWGVTAYLIKTTSSSCMTAVLHKKPFLKNILEGLI